VVKRVHIYVEGGGKHSNKYASDQVRRGFTAFIRGPLGDKGDQIRVVSCGSREATFRDFLKGAQTNPARFNVFLVDSDGPVTGSAWEHLRSEAGWDMRGIEEDQCHLMVQIMEAWLLADAANLADYYKQGFNARKIPKVASVESVNKVDVLRVLDEATRVTKKGKYDKVAHGSKLLEKIEAGKVRKVADHCDRLFKTLTDKITPQT
jgi:hypothetical protein